MKRSTVFIALGVVAVLSGCERRGPTSPGDIGLRFLAGNLRVDRARLVGREQLPGLSICSLEVTLRNTSGGEIRQVLLYYEGFAPDGSLVALTAVAGEGVLGFGDGEFPSGATLVRSLVWIEEGASNPGGNNPGNGNWIRDCDEIGSFRLDKDRSHVVVR